MLMTVVILSFPGPSREIVGHFWQKENRSWRGKTEYNDRTVAWRSYRSANQPFHPTPAGPIKFWFQWNFSVFSVSITLVNRNIGPVARFFKSYWDFQAEVDRYQGSVRLIRDYYQVIEKKILDEPRKDFTRVPLVELPRTDTPRPPRWNLELICW